MDRIAFGKSIKDMLLEYPCLKRVLQDEQEQLVFSSDKINKIMGCNFVKMNDPLTSKLMNSVLDKLLGEI